MTVATGRTRRILELACGWCRGPLEATRRDARYCRKACRQAAHRAKVERAQLQATDRPLRLAYADPPYPGTARRYYGAHPDFAGEVDHADLIRRLAEYDGWALSTSARALPDVLAIAAPLVDRPRVAVWVRNPAPHPTARVLTSWEAVIYRAARGVARRRGEPATLDVLLGVEARRRATLPTAVVGMKPPRFCEWLFRLIDARPGDSLDDLYPGSGMVGRAWAQWSAADPRDASPVAV